MGARFSPSRIQTPQERQELFIVPDADEVPAQQIYLLITWASTRPRGPRPVPVPQILPCACRADANMAPPPLGPGVFVQRC